MNWGVIGSISELVSALAVVVSVVYVAVQLRANTKTIRASAAWDAEKLFIDLNDNAARDPQYCEMATRIYQEESVDAFNQTENMQIRFAVISLTQATQAQYFMWREGNLLDEVWNYRLKWFRNWILVPVVQAHWEQIKPEHLLSEGFINEVESEQGQVEFKMGVTKKVK